MSRNFHVLMHVLMQKFTKLSRSLGRHHPWWTPGSSPTCWWYCRWIRRGKQKVLLCSWINNIERRVCLLAVPSGPGRSPGYSTHSNEGSDPPSALSLRTPPLSSALFCGQFVAVWMFSYMNTANAHQRAGKDYFNPVSLTFKSCHQRSKKNFNKNMMHILRVF